MPSDASNDLAEESVILGIEATFQLKCSHNVASPGFQSQQIGLFKFIEADDNNTDGLLIFRDVNLIGTELTRLQVRPNGPSQLRATFDFKYQTSEFDAYVFIHQLADAWSAKISHDQKDPWYGNLYIEVNWSDARIISGRNNWIGIGMSLASTIQRQIEVERIKLEQLRWAPLTEIFVEGMKSAQPKAKFLFWFVPLEELEKRKEFSNLFTPMFSDIEKKQLFESADLNPKAKKRLTDILNHPATTMEGRPAKLKAILEKIGITEVDFLPENIPVDEKFCKALIDQRNKIAHQGSELKEGLLYNKLFPVSKKVLEYLVMKDQQNS